MDYEGLYYQDADDLVRIRYYTFREVLNHMSDKLNEVGLIRESETTLEIIEDIEMVRKLMDELESKIKEVKGAWRIIEKVDEGDMGEDAIEKFKLRGMIR